MPTPNFDYCPKLPVPPCHAGHLDYDDTVDDHGGHHRHEPRWGRRLGIEILRPHGHSIVVLCDNPKCVHHCEIILKPVYPGSSQKSWYFVRGNGTPLTKKHLERTRVIVEQAHPKGAPTPVGELMLCSACAKIIDTLDLEALLK